MIHRIQLYNYKSIQMENENATKSIIYGNTFENKYGKFMPICSSILDRSSITSIIDYLKQTPHFKKFNRIAYAYRVDQMPVVFITEKKNIQTQYYEGFHSDQTVEGSGQKLLHLLEKFNIRNVLIAVLIQQFHPLLPFQCTNYRAIVQNSRMLLDQLYRKVVQFQEQNGDRNINDLLLTQQKSFKMKKVDLAQQIIIPILKKPVPKQRPNYVYNQSTKPAFTAKIQKKPSQINQQQIGFLWDRCKVMKQQYKKIIETLEDKQLQEMRYFVMYDKNQLINNVVLLFTIYQGITKEQIVQEYDFARLKKLEIEALTTQKLRKMDQILKTNKKINVDNVLKINRALGMIYSLIEIHIRYSKNLERITALIEKAEKKSVVYNSKQVHSNAVKIDVQL